MATVETTPGMQPLWSRKHAEGKMAQRRECAQCHACYNFTDTPRMTRVPRCPFCGSVDSFIPAA